MFGDGDVAKRWEGHKPKSEQKMNGRAEFTSCKPGKSFQRGRSLQGPDPSSVLHLSQTMGHAWYLG